MWGRLVLTLGLAVLTLPFLPLAAAEAADPECNVNPASILGFSQNTEEDQSGSWINGDLNANNSHYAEGDWVPHRIELGAVKPGVHKVEASYDILKNGKFAYDQIGFLGIEDGTATGNNLTLTELDRPTDAQLYAASAAGQTVTVHFKLTFTAPAGSNGNLTLHFAAHVASELDWGPGLGAGSISGSPYHVSLSTLDCASAGQRDNQMKASAVQGGFLRIAKDVQPGTDAQDFDFTITQVATGANRLTHLDDDADATLPSNETYFLAPGQYTITESSLAGWQLVSITCTGGTATTNVGTRTATVTVVDQSGQSNPVPLSCTFVNSKLSGPGGSAGNVTKTFDRDWDWTIDKHLAQGQSATENDAPGGAAAAFDYEVTVTPSGPQDSAWKVAGQFTVTNQNPLAITEFTASASTSGGTCTVDNDPGTPGTQTGAVSIPAASGGTDGSKTFGYSCTFASNPGSGEMTLGGSWPSSSSLGSAGSLTITPKPSYDFAGATPTNETDKTVVISDNRVDVNGDAAGTTVTLDAADGTQNLTYSWAPDTSGQTAGTCADYTNTASLAADDADGDNNSTETDSQTVTVCLGAPLTVNKDGNPTLTRSYGWDIDKLVKDANGDYVPSSSADPVTENGGAGGATFEYKVRVTMGAATDSNWQMTGHITVSNPNTFESVTLTGLTDDPTLGDFAESCSVSPDSAYPSANSMTIPASATHHFVYTCQLTDPPAPGNQISSADYTGTNTATATWDAAAAHTTTGTASKTINITESMWTDDMTEVNKTISVWDDKTDPAHPVKLGQVTWTAAGLYQDFTYSLTKTAPAGSCSTYDNNVWVEADTNATADDAGHLADDTATVKVCRPTGPTVDKTVTASHERTYHWLIAKSVDHQNDTVDGDENATFNYGVTVTPNGYTDHGYVMNGSITVTNPNDFMSITVNVTDVPDVGAGATCTVTNGTNVTIAASGSATRSYSCSFAEGYSPKSGASNVGRATWNGTAYDSDAKPVSFSLGTEHLKTIHVTDDKTGDTQGALGTWNWADGEHTFEYSLDLGSPAGTCTPYTNTAWITETSQSADAMVQVCSNGALVVTKHVTATKDRTYHWTIDKTVEDDEIHVPAGEKANFDYTVTVGTDGYTDHTYRLLGTIDVENPNDFTSVTVDVTDVPDVGAGVTCDVTGGEDLVVAAGDTETVSYECTFPDGYAPGGKGTNTAHVAWNGEDFTDTSNVSYSLRNEQDKTVNVTDDKTGGTQLPIVTSPGDQLEYFDVAAHPSHGVFSYDLDLGSDAGTCATYDNRAQITQTEQHADESVKVCTEADLGIAKTVDASKTRTYLWDVDKSADDNGTPSSVDGSDGTFDYTVDVSQTGYTDSEFAMSGTITVSNPNDFESVTVDVSDVPNVGGGATCTVTDGDGWELAPMGEEGDSHTFDYTCEFAGPGNPADGDNTATAAWTDPNGDGASVSDTQDVDFEITDTVNKTIHVTDSVAGALGTVTWDDEAELGSVVQTYHYPLTWTGTPGTCTDFDNTATITETKQSDTATVTLCVIKGLTTASGTDASYDLTYPWDIDKSVRTQDGEGTANADGGSFDVGPGGTQQFDYSVVVSSAQPTEHGWELTGSATVTNTNDWRSIPVEFTGVRTDVTSPATDCVFDSPTSGVLDAADGAAGSVISMTATYHCTVVDPSHTGHVTVDYTWDGTPAFITTDVTFGLDDEFDKTVTVTDTQDADGVLGTVTWGEGEDEGQEGEQWTFDYTLDHGSAPGECTEHENTATLQFGLDETPALRTAARELAEGLSDSTTVTVCERAPLGVQQVADGSYDVTYPWEIVKDAAQTEFETLPGGTVTADYTVTVTPGDAVDSGWEVTGQVLVSNPNTFGDPATVGSIALEGLGDDATCSLTSSDPVVVPLGATVPVDYTCVLSQAPADGATITATVTWLDTVASADATPAFAVDEETDKTIDVVDDQTRPTEAPVALGTVDWNADGTPTDFTYSVELGAAEEPGCVTYTNTAMITQTEQSDTADVAVCGVPPVEPPVPPEPPVEPPIVVPPHPAPPPPAVVLPPTGASAGTEWAAVGGALMLLLGGWLTVAARRRREVGTD